MTPGGQERNDRSVETNLCSCKKENKRRKFAPIIFCAFGSKGIEKRDVEAERESKRERKMETRSTVHKSKSSFQAMRAMKSLERRLNQSHKSGCFRQHTAQRLPSRLSHRGNGYKISGENKLRV